MISKCKWVFVECVVEIPRTKLSFAFVVCYVMFVCLSVVVVVFFNQEIFFSEFFSYIYSFPYSLFICLYF